MISIIALAVHIKKQKNQSRKTKNRQINTEATMGNQNNNSTVKAGYIEQTQRPIVSLVFLLPWILFYELSILFMSQGNAEYLHNRVIAYKLLRHFFMLFGATGIYLPGLAVIAFLLFQQLSSNQPWKFPKSTIAGMFLESSLLAVPLLVLAQITNTALTGKLAATQDNLSYPIFKELLLSIGAGIYEELLFRLILITLLNIILVDLLKLQEGPAVFLIVILSAIIFSLYHYLGPEPFEITSFVFRTIAGGYLTGIYILRGFGIVVGTHIFYDIGAVLINVWLT